MVVEKVKNEEGEVTGYKAYSKNYPNVHAAEGDTQFAAIQSYHRRMRVFQSTENEEKANAADVSGIIRA
jgi:hypothetical protein